MAGRPVGAKNKRTLRVEEIAGRYALDPFEVLMMIAVGDWEGLGYETKTKKVYTAEGRVNEEENVPLAQRCVAAREATKYLYPTKHRVEITKEQAIEFLENEINRNGAAENSEDSDEG